MLRAGYQFGSARTQRRWWALLSKKLGAVLAAGAATVGLVAVAVPGSSATVDHANKTVNWSKVTHLTASGPTSYSALVKAAEAEGHLNVITLPSNWANYGTIMSDFSKKFHIAINSENPEGSSANEISAMQQDKGRADDPDVVDVGQSFGIEAAEDGLLAPYKVQTWQYIPSAQKSPSAYWWGDYGGYVAIGCNTKPGSPSALPASQCPTSFKEILADPHHDYKVGLNNNPTQASAAFSAVFAAALASGGNFNNILPGVKYFASLNKEGAFVPVIANGGTIETGATNIILWWDYLQASEIQAPAPGGDGLGKYWKVTIPTDASYAAYYDQGINKDAPNPAAARLWEEYLYSATGQNLWLQGEARPIELPYLISSHQVNQKWLAALPPAPKGVTKFPSQGQVSNAKKVVANYWGTLVTSGP
jgi:putative spermidine/putrescine transport system substrate-binding protein